MSVMGRWVRFNAVGVVGMGVQLGSLAVLSRWVGGHTLVATAVALELTLLHNFMWHRRYTWRERGAEGDGMWGQLVRFHVSNGVVSLVGNLTLMWVLAGHLGVLAANGVAIVCCSVVNFFLGERWAFAVGREEEGGDFLRISETGGDERALIR